MLTNTFQPPSLLYHQACLIQIVHQVVSAIYHKFVVKVVYMCSCVYVYMCTCVHVINYISHQVCDSTSPSPYTVTKFVVNLDPRCVQLNSWCCTGSISLYLQIMYKIAKTAFLEEHPSVLLWLCRSNRMNNIFILLLLGLYGVLCCSCSLNCSLQQLL